MIRFGIIGFGFMGHKHAATLEKLDWARLNGVCDIDASTMEDAPAGVRLYSDPAELVRDPEIDVVIISANNNQHLKLILLAAEAGRDIICEKPACLSVAELDEAAAAVEKNGVLFTVHQQRRLDKNFQTAKAVLEQGLLGQVYLIKSLLYGYNGNMHDWHVHLAEGGGMLYDWGVHLLDQILFMVDAEPETVYADVRNVINVEVDDYFKIQLKFSSGLSVEVELGTYLLNDAPDWFGQHFILCGSTGTAHIDGFAGTGKIVRTTRLLENAANVRTMTAAGPTRSFGQKPDGILVTEPLPAVQSEQLDYFRNYYAAYTGGGDFLVQLPEVRRVLRLLEAVRESARTGRAVEFAQYYC